MGKIHHDVIFCVFGCSTIRRYRDQILKINSTWGAKAKIENYKVLFFLGEEKSELQGDEYVYLKGVQNDYLSASYKQNLGLKYITDNFTFNYVHVCGTDTYVNINKLKIYLRMYNSDDNICIGGHGCYRKINHIDWYYHSGGPGFIISRCAVNKIKYLLHNMVNDWKKIINSHTSTPELIFACDLALCYYLKIHDCNLIKDDESFFHCNHKGFPCHPGRNLGINIVACHNMSLSDFDDYTNILNCWK